MKSAANFTATNCLWTRRWRNVLHPTEPSTVFWLLLQKQKGGAAKADLFPAIGRNETRFRCERDAQNKMTASGAERRRRRRRRRRATASAVSRTLGFVNWSRRASEATATQAQWGYNKGKYPPQTQTNTGAKFQNGVLAPSANHSRRNRFFFSIS